MNTIRVRAPKFEIYQRVVLFWNGSEHYTKIVRRWFDAEDDYWWYKIHGSEQLFPESVLEANMTCNKTIA